MARFTVGHAYQSQRDGQQFGRWERGIEVELSEEDAAWVNRDSPGTLAPAVKAKPASAPEPEPEPEAGEREAKPAPNRQARRTPNRAAG